MRLDLDDPRLRAWLAGFEATAVVIGTLLLSMAAVVLGAPRSALVVAELAGQPAPRLWAMLPGPRPHPAEALAWMLALQNLVLLGVGATLAALRGPRMTAAVSWPGRIGWGLSAGLVAFSVSGAIAALQELAGVPVLEQEPLLEVLRRIPLQAALPWVAIAAPLGEEVFFRGYLFRFLASRGPLWLAHAFSASAFAAVHLNPSGLLVYGAIGLVLAGAYRRTGSLLVPVLGHAVHNAITLLGIYASP